MSLRRSFLSRRITSRSLAFSKSFKEFKTLESSEQSGNCGGDEEGDCEVVGSDGSDRDSSNGDLWSNMLPELLGEIIRRVEASDGEWPLRQNVVTCGCVCKRWREITREVVKTPLQGGSITFPSCLKQPGPRDSPLQCLIKRNKKNATFYLYLALTPSFTDKGKFLLAARRVRQGAHTEYIISLDADDLSQRSNAYVGKLSSDFLGTNFTIYDSQPPHDGAKPTSSRAGRRIASKQISPHQVSASNYEIGHVSYKFNLLKSRGPRRMICSMNCLPSPSEKHDLDFKSKLPESSTSTSSSTSTCGWTILKNKDFVGLREGQSLSEMDASTVFANECCAKSGLESPSAEKKRKLEGVDDQQKQEVDEEQNRFENDRYLDYSNGAKIADYWKQVKESEGFDVDFVPEMDECGLITPLKNFEESQSLLTDLEAHSRMAIQNYNSEKGVRFEFVKVIKANARGAGGFMFYITFEAKDSTSSECQSVRTFQALVFEPMSGDINVRFCRLPPQH